MIAASHTGEPDHVSRGAIDSRQERGRAKTRCVRRPSSLTIERAAAPRSERPSAAVRSTATAPESTRASWRWQSCIGAPLDAYLEARILQSSALHLENIARACSAWPAGNIRARRRRLRNPDNRGLAAGRRPRLRAFRNARRLDDATQPRSQRVKWAMQARSLVRRRDRAFDTRLMEATRERSSARAAPKECIATR